MDMQGLPEYKVVSVVLFKDEPQNLKKLWYDSTFAQQVKLHLSFWNDCCMSTKYLVTIFPTLFSKDGHELGHARKTQSNGSRCGLS